MLTSELLHINTYTVRKSYEEEKAVNHLQECTVQLSTVAITWGLSFNPKREKSLWNKRKGILQCVCSELCWGLQEGV